MPTIQTSRFLQALFYFALAIPSRAQPSQSDTLLSPAAARTALFYQSYIGSNAAIYSGRVYQPPYQGVKGSPYFLSDNLTEGTVRYEDLTYTHLQLLYNTIQDQPILADHQGRLLALPAEKVRQFTIDSHSFIHLSANAIPAGYYELLQAGYATLLVRHTKKIEEKIQGGDLIRYITAHENYYLFKQGRYYPFDSDNGLLHLLADKKQQLQQYQRAQHIRFRKDPVAAMEKLLDYYNQLPH